MMISILLTITCNGGGVNDDGRVNRNTFYLTEELMWWVNNCKAM